jgi:UMF1 family MFS transporter
MIASLLLVQFIGIPFAFAFGILADWIGAKASVLAGLAVYVGITVFGFFMKTEAHFLTLAVLVAMVQGGTQALSRSMFARMVPKHKTGEFFGFFSVFNRFGGMMGTGMFALMALVTNQTRWAIMSVALFFVVGAALLALVNVSEGERVARANEP